MDDSWQRKCGSIWQASTPPPAATSLEGSQNQVLHAGLHFRPNLLQESVSSAPEMVHTPMLHWTSNIRSYSSGYGEGGSTLLSLLSGPSPSLQFDLPLLSSLKPSFTSSNIPISSCTSNDSAAGAAISFLSAGQSEPSDENKNVADTNLQKLEYPRIVASLNPSTEFSSLKGRFNGDMKLPNVPKFHHRTHIPVSGWAPTEIDSSISLQSSMVSSEYLHVFCLGIRGFLLLSSTGVLGVVCSCHGLHMSVAKFAEHSGLNQVNPGNAIHMESGETIAQWRKVYFQKLGIRAPDEHGWDWPDGFSAAAGLVKQVATIPYVSKQSNLPNEVDSSEASMRFEQPHNGVSLHDSSYSGKKVVGDFAYDKSQNFQESAKSLSSDIISTSHSSMLPGVDKHVMRSLVFGSSTAANIGGPRGTDNPFPSISAYLNSISECGNSSIFTPNLQNLRIPGQGFDVVRINTPIVENDMVPSNIELKLGQPSQQHLPFGSSVRPAFRPHLVPSHSEPQKSVFLDHIMYKTTTSRVTEESRQFLQFGGATSGCHARGEQSHSDLVNYTYGVNGMTNSSQTEQCQDGGSRSSVIAMVLSHSNRPEEKRLSKFTSHSINDTPLLEGKMHCGSHIARCEQEEKCSLGFQSSSGVAGVTDARGTFNCSGKNSYIGHKGNIDECFPRTVSFPVASGATLSSEPIPVGFLPRDPIFVQSLSSLVSNKEATALVPNLSDEHLRMLALQRLQGLSYQEHLNGSQRTIHDQEISRNSSEKPRVSVSSPISKEQAFELNFPSMLNASEVPRGSCLSSVNYLKGSNSERISPLIELSQEKSLHPKECGMQREFSHGLHPTQWSLLRLHRSGENVTTADEQQKCFHTVLHPSFGDKCCCVTQANCLAGKYDFNSEPLLCEFRKPKATAADFNSDLSKNLFPSKQNDNYNLSGAKSNSLCQNGNLMGQKPINDRSCFFQWKDVPEKVTKSCISICQGESTNLFNTKSNDGKKMANPDATASLCCNRGFQDSESLKEQEMSNISSGGSAPVLTQDSIEVDKKDSPVFAGERTHANNLIVDEGSGIDRCWSSDDALGSERSSENGGFASKLSLIDEGLPEAFTHQSSRSLVDEIRLQDSLRLKKVQKHMHPGFDISQKSIQIQKIENNSRKGKRKKTTKCKKIDSTFPAPGSSVVHCESTEHSGAAGLKSHSIKDVEIQHQYNQGSSSNYASSEGPSFKWRRSRLRKRNLHRICDIEEKDIDTHTNLTSDDYYFQPAKGLGRKRLKMDAALPIKHADINNQSCMASEIMSKYISVDCLATSSSEQEDDSRWMARPVVSGKYGVISNGNSSKPPNIVPLGRILKKMKTDSSVGSGEANLSSNTWEKATTRGCQDHMDKNSSLKEMESFVVSDEVNIRTGEGREVACSCSEQCPCCSSEEIERERICKGKKLEHCLGKIRHTGCDSKNRISRLRSRLKQKCKEIRKRSLYELSVKAGKVSTSAHSFLKKDLQAEGRYPGEHFEAAEVAKIHQSETHESKKDQRCQSFQGLDAFCCVCGSSNKDEDNFLLECNQCLIKVHQACYGVSKVPKAHWYCRPCRTRSKNIVCVLCGYGGGAMTCALRSQNIVKSLLLAWNVVTESKAKNPVSSEHVENRKNVFPLKAVPISSLSSPMTLANKESSSGAVSAVDQSKHLFYNISSSSPGDSNVSNSVIAGTLDPTVKQWVHMVCGLWTPGTRCPNVDTMSAFDVSGATHRKNVVRG